MTTQITALTLMINNEVVGYVAGTLSFKDGAGTSVVTNAVVGAEATEQIFSEDLSSKFGMVKFEMPTTEENEIAKRKWKANRNNNVIELIGPRGTNFARVFTQAASLEDPETNIATDGTIAMEFASNPAQ